MKKAFLSALAAVLFFITINSAVANNCAQAGQRFAQARGSVLVSVEAFQANGKIQCKLVLLEENKSGPRKRVTKIIDAN